MSAAVTFTIADLERMPDDGMHRELLDGELIELPPSKFGHQSVAKRLFVRFKIFRDLSNWLQPDVSATRAERIQGVGGDEYVEGAPNVAFEIISPSERAGDVHHKTEAYLKAGTKAVVNIYPKRRRVTIHMANGSPRTLQGDDVLRLPNVLPGWEVALSEIFGLERAGV